MALISIWAMLSMVNFDLWTGKWSPVHKQPVRGHFWSFGLEFFQEYPHDTDQVFGVAQGPVIGGDVGADGPVVAYAAVVGLGLGLALIGFRLLFRILFSFLGCGLMPWTCPRSYSHPGPCTTCS